MNPNPEGEGEGGRWRGGEKTNWSVSEAGVNRLQSRRIGGDDMTEPAWRPRRAAAAAAAAANAIPPSSNGNFDQTRRAPFIDAEYISDDCGRRAS